MNYIAFCHHKNHVTSLTNHEIENPYLVIDELCKKRTMETFHLDLRILQSTIYRDNEWMNHNPADLYTTYEDTLRLVDTLFLINEFTPEISTISGTSIRVESNNAINKLLKKGHSENNYQKDQILVNPTTTLSAIYSDHELHILKEDLFNCLQIGLDISYMNNTKHEYFGGDINNYALLFIALEDLITEMYQIHRKETVTSIRLTSCLETKFSINSEHPTHLLKYEIKKPYSTLFVFYHHNINHEHIYTGLKAWKQLLFKKNVWKKAHNPGNLIHLNQCLIELIDIVWLLIQNNQLKNIKKNYTAKKSYKKLIKACNDVEFNNPIIAIENFMAYKKMHEWKALLYTWLKCSLDNDQNYLIDDKDRIDLEFNHLIKFAEAVLLLSLPSIKKKKH